MHRRAGHTSKTHTHARARARTHAHTQHTHTHSLTLTHTLSHTPTHTHPHTHTHTHTHPHTTIYVSRPCPVMTLHHVPPDVKLHRTTRFTFHPISPVPPVAIRLSAYNSNKRHVILVVPQLLHSRYLTAPLLSVQTVPLQKDKHPLSWVGTLALIQELRSPPSHFGSCTISAPTFP